MIMALCEWCNEMIDPRKGSNLFCNMKCYREWNASFRPKLVCEICKNVYTQPEERAKISTTCSKHCRAIKAGQAARLVHLGKNDVNLICLNCEKDFLLPYGKSKGRKYCCKVCQIEHKKRTKQKISCKLCGKEKFVKPYELKTAKYCSRNCKDEDQRNLTGDKNPNYIDGRKIYRREALKLFNYQCKSCKKIDRRLHVHHIDGNNKNNDPTNWMVLCRYVINAFI